MCRVMLVMIIFVLDLFKFQVIRNSLRHFPSYTNFMFGTVSYCSSSCCCSSSSFSSFLVYFSTMSFSLSRPYSIFSIILLHNKESVSRTICSISAGVSRVAPTGADKALHNFANWFLIQLVMFIINRSFGNLQKIFMDKKWVRGISVAITPVIHLRYPLAGVL